jgi:hypothetical protein
VAQGCKADYDSIAYLRTDVSAKNANFGLLRLPDPGYASVLVMVGACSMEPRGSRDSCACGASVMFVLIWAERGIELFATVGQVESELQGLAQVGRHVRD